jgi:hypothetical protein
MWLATGAVWILVALLLLPWEVRFYRHRVADSPIGEKIAGESTGRPLLRFRTTPMGIPFTLYTFAAGKSLGPSFRELHADRWGAVKRHAGVLVPAGLLFFGLLAWGLLGPVVDTRRMRLQLLAWLLVPPFLVWAVAVLGLKELNPRYAFAAFPAFIILISAGWAGLPTRRSRIIAAFFAAFLWGGALVRVHADPAYAKEDYRAASAWLREQLEPGTLWVTVGIDAPLRNYYMKELFEGRELLLPGDYRRLGFYAPGHVARFWAGVREAVPGHRKVILFESRNWGLDPDGICTSFMNGLCEAPVRRSWNGIQVAVCDRPASTEEAAAQAAAAGGVRDGDDDG